MRKHIKLYIDNDIRFEGIVNLPIQIDDNIVIMELDNSLDNPIEILEHALDMDNIITDNYDEIRIEHHAIKLALKILCEYRKNSSMK